jgi:Icc-related predicted phosphoesterase
MESDILKIAVVSDLHFQPKSLIQDNGKSSWLTIESNTINNNFWDSFTDVIRDDNITADLLLCPGDITTYANKEGLHFAWQKLNELRELLKCEVLAAATGNHDVQSRPKLITNEIRDLNQVNDLTENLKNLVPTYPLVEMNGCEQKAHERRVHYFGTDYIIYDENEDYRLVIFNSCSRHTSKPSDHERGHISKSTLDWLKNSLTKVYDPNDKKISIFVCHHHPIQHDDHNSGSYDFIQGGAKLIEELNNFGSWIIIHGHKHHAKISYHTVGSKKSVVFAAGTLSSHKDTLGVEFANQFYILSIDKNSLRGTLSGTVTAWSWMGNKWGVSKSTKDGVYTGVGFGDVGCIETLAESISCEMKELVIPLKWDELVGKFPQLRNFVPKDFQMLEMHLLHLDIDLNYNQQSEFESLERRVRESK